MPSINIPITPAGPIVQIMLGVSIPKADAMKKAGVPVPKFVAGNFLVDTGASCTCVDPQVVAPLGLAPSGSVSIQTPSTAGNSHQCNQYDASIYIPNGASGGHFIDAMPVLETHLSSQGIDGLIGRDILDRCTLVYNGSLGVLTLAY